MPDIPICDYQELKTPICTPPPQWWIFLGIVHACMFFFDVALTTLQSVTALASQQKESLQQLRRNIANMCYATRRIFEQTNIQDEVSFGNYSISNANCVRFIKDQGIFLAEKFCALSYETQMDVVNGIFRFDGICGERNERNEATEFLPLPYDWIKLATSELGDILRFQQARLSTTVDREFMRQIEGDHKGLKRAFQVEEPLKNILQTHNAHTGTSFKEGWESVNGRFQHLMMFSAGLATVFPGTASDESDFSILIYE